MEIREGIVKAFDSGGHAATVQLTGSLAVYLSDVPAALNIAAVEMRAGRRNAALFFDQGNPQDAVVIAAYT